MARDHLSDELISVGQSILRATDEFSMQAQGAMWLFDHDLEDWRYYLVSSIVDTLGRRRAYRLLIDVFDRIRLPETMTIQDVHLGSPKERLFQLISKLVGVNGGVVRVENCSVDGVLFDGVVYRSVLNIPSEQQASLIEKEFTEKVRDIESA